MRHFISLLVMALVLTNCGNEKSDEEVRSENEMEIQQYLSDNNLTSEVTASGLHYIIDVPGNGQNPTINDQVTVHYHGYFTHGDVFDSSVDRGQPLSFFLTQVIQGWQEGIPLFSKGAEGVLLIPSHLGYGRDGRGSIPGNSVLVFDIQLLDF